MPSEQMQAFIDALRDRIPQHGSLTLEQHRAMHDALLARRPPDEDVRVEAATPTERLIDDARRLVERARLPGVPATLDVTEGAVHAFPATAPETPEAGAAIGRIAHHLTVGLET